jgi:hypothetical protein
MRKQKASDKRTRRRQQRADVEAVPIAASTLTASPMKDREWRTKQGQTAALMTAVAARKTIGSAVAATTAAAAAMSSRTTGTRHASRGRQRSRKRSALYNALSLYHNTFVNQLTFEYQAEVRLIFRSLLTVYILYSREQGTN